MIPLKLALVHRGHWYRNEARIDGQFAYPVPGLTWTHHNVDRSFDLDIRTLGDVDAVWWDDGKYSDVRFTPEKGARKVPIVFWALYPTLAAHIRQTRLSMIRPYADAVLLDHDNPDFWPGIPGRRLAYSVNERYYRDRGLNRDVDVGFYNVWGHNPLRPAFDAWLEGLCKRHGWRYWSNKGQFIGTQYATLLARTKVVVHLNRTPDTRPPRIFDCAACGTALLSNPMPRLPGENWVPWWHYGEFVYPRDQYEENVPDHKPLTDADCPEVIEGLEWMLDRGAWQAIAQNAKEYVLACHTWEQRAWELRGILLDLFPALREKVGEGYLYQ